MQLLEEPTVYQVIPFMTHLELNHIKDDKSDSEKAHKGQEAVKLVNMGLQPEYKGRFKLQVISTVTVDGTVSGENVVCACVHISASCSLLSPRLGHMIGQCVKHLEACCRTS